MYTSIARGGWRSEENLRELKHFLLLGNRGKNYIIILSSNIFRSHLAMSIWKKMSLLSAS